MNVSEKLAIRIANLELDKAELECKLQEVMEELAKKEEEIQKLTSNNDDEKKA